MAEVGSAYIVVRAITNQVRDDIRNGMRGVPDLFDQAGRDSGRRFSDGFGKGGGGGKGIFSDLKNESEAASDKLTSLITTGYAVGPAIAGIVGAVGAAASGIFALGAQAASAAPALLSLVNVFTAVAQAAVVFKVAVSGVGAAISAGLAPPRGGKSAEQRAKEIEDAADRVKDAEKRLAQVRNANAIRLENAQDRLDEARKRELEAYADIANYQTAEAEASDAVAEARSRVAEATDEATESIQQLRFELEEAVLSEQRAVLNFEDAREELAKVSNLPPNNRQRREAELAFAEADLRLRRAKDATSDTAKEVDKANEKGIEGSDQVVAARQRVTDAEKAYARAQQATIDAGTRATEATKAREKAFRDLNVVIAENKAREEEAQESLNKAKENLEDVKKGTNDASGGVDKFAEAMAKLSPSAQEFVRYILDIKDKFTDLKKETQEAFFSRINDDIKDLVNTYLPLLNRRLPETAAVLAGVGEKLIGVFNDPENVAKIDKIFGSNTKIIDDLGTAVSNLASIFIDLLDAAAPLAEELAEWVKNLTEGWKETVEADSKSGDLKTTLDQAAGVVRILAGLFGDLFGAIKNIGVAAAGPGSGGEMLLGWLRDAVAGWKEFTGSTEGQSRLEKFFQNVAPVAREMGRILAKIGKAIFETTEAGVDPGKGAPLLRFFESISSAVDKISSMGPALTGVLPTIGAGLDSAAGAIANLTASGAIEKFFEVLKGFADFAQDLTSNPIFQQIFGIVAPIFAIGRGLSLILTFSRFLFMGAIVGGVMQFVDAFKAVTKFFAAGGAFSRIPLLGPAFSGLLAPILGATGPLLAVIAVLAGLVLIFVAMWRESEKFREAIKNLIDKVIKKAQESFQKLRDKLDEALASIGGTEGAINMLRGAFKWLGDFVADYIIPIFEDYLMFAFDYLVVVIGTIIDAIGNFIEAWQKIIKGFQEGDIGMIFQGIFEAITAGFRAVLDTILGFFGTSLEEVWNNIVSWFTDVGAEISSWPGRIGEWLVGLWNSFYNYLEEQWNRAVAIFGPNGIIATFLRGLPSRVREWLTGIWNSFYTFLEDQWNRVVNVYGPNGIIATFLRGLPARIRDWLTGVWDSLYDFIAGPNGIWSRITSFFSSSGPIPSFFRNLATNIASWAAGVWDGLGDAFVNVLRSIVSAWNNLRLGPITMPDNAFTQFLGIAGQNFAIDTPNLPLPTRLAMGGVVPATSGGLSAILGEAGRAERVEPLDPDGLSKRDKAMISYLTGGSGGATINVYPSEGMNERELAQMVSKELAYMMRKGGI